MRVNNDFQSSCSEDSAVIASTTTPAQLPSKRPASNPGCALLSACRIRYVGRRHLQQAPRWEQPASPKAKELEEDIMHKWCDDVQVELSFHRFRCGWKMTRCDENRFRAGRPHFGSDRSLDRPMNHYFRAPETVPYVRLKRPD